MADSLLEHFPVSGWGLRLLLPRVESGGRTVLAEAFAAGGARVVEVAAYETRCPAGLPSAAVAALSGGELDAITFSSAKTVSHTVQLLQAGFGEAWPRCLRDVAVVSIGPQTSRRCEQELGRVDAEADPHDLEGLVQACVEALRAQPNTRLLALTQGEQASVHVDRGDAPARRQQVGAAAAPVAHAQGPAVVPYVHDRLGLAGGADHAGEAERRRQGEPRTGADRLPGGPSSRRHGGEGIVAAGVDRSHHLRQAWARG